MGHILWLCRFAGCRRRRRRLVIVLPCRLALQFIVCARRELIGDNPTKEQEKEEPANKPGSQRVGAEGTFPETGGIFDFNSDTVVSSVASFSLSIRCFWHRRDQADFYSMQYYAERGWRVKIEKITSGFR